MIYYGLTRDEIVDLGKEITGRLWFVTLRMGAFVDCGRLLEVHCAPLSPYGFSANALAFLYSLDPPVLRSLFVSLHVTGTVLGFTLGPSMVLSSLRQVNPGVSFESLLGPALPNGFASGIH